MGLRTRGRPICPPIKAGRVRQPPPPPPHPSGEVVLSDYFSYHTQTMLDIFRLGQILHSSPPLLPFLLFSFLLPAVFFFPFYLFFLPYFPCLPSFPSLPPLFSTPSLPPFSSPYNPLPSPPLTFSLPSSPSSLFPLPSLFLLHSIILLLAYSSFSSYSSSCFSLPSYHLSSPLTFLARIELKSRNAEYWFFIQIQKPNS